ncbi:hypothetical protein [Baekduia sp.]|jgi:hypothetical protein|uniref:hypothetical protein n=1 Tax=Baekduia sp. TaxID=2600305 RepID=UPI002DFFEE2F|nr:hypothetical protein [Baekduia sp.]
MIKETKMTATRARMFAPARRRWIGTLLVVALTLLALGADAGSAGATTNPVPGWRLDNFATPTNFSAAHNAAPCVDTLTNNTVSGQFCDSYQLTATNAGAESADGTPVTLTDTLPPGLTVQRIEFVWAGHGAQAAGLLDRDLSDGLCTATPTASTNPVSCQLDTSGFGLPPIAPDDSLRMIIYVTVDDPGASGPLTSSGTVAGGGAPAISTTLHNQISSETPTFGMSALTATISDADGTADTQAAAHPYELVTRIDLANRFGSTAANPTFGFTSVEDVRDVVVDLPLGLLGSSVSTPRCTLAQLSGPGSCPAATQVGHILTHGAGATDIFGTTHNGGPIFNIVPEHGVAAEFGFADALKISHILYARVVPGPDGYVLRTTTSQVPQVFLTDITATFYGIPAVKDQSGESPIPFLTNPSDCSGRPLVTSVYSDSWSHPGRVNGDGTPDLADPDWKSATSSSPPVTGCNKLHFESSLSVKPDTTVADSPSGVDVDIKVPQPQGPNTLATPPLKKAVVTLPSGFTVNPGSADGLASCSSAQIDLASAAEPSCPDASKIGTVTLTTPLLPDTLTGAIYLGAQNDNPFGSVLAGYIVVDDPTTGVVIKIPGKLTSDPQTGQITGTFDNNPQFPFSDLKLHFFGGTRGTLATPESCGSFTTTSELTPWSAPDSGPPSMPSSVFSITSGCTGGFAPAFTAGVTNPSAGHATSFALQLDRADGQQHIKSVTTTLPGGVLANVGSVPLCSDADASAGTCPGGSQIGSTDAAAGPGPHPFHLPGKVFLTGPYKGGPYGLSIVVPAIAGPFNLGTVVVRAAIQVDPTDAHVTVISDDVPHILDVAGRDGQTDGFPTRIRSIDVNIDRPGFMINPTSCDPMSIAGSIGSWEGGSAAVSSHFQVGNCSALAVDPKLAIALTGKGQTTDDKHPGVDATLTQKPGQANLKKVVVTLPLSLALDPDNAQGLCEFTDGSKVEPTCPKTSIVGTATARTPILDGPLTGPVYFVKNIRIDAKSGRQIRTLPKLVVPLTGPNGVRLNLTGTSNVVDDHLVNTFDQIPDAPVSDFKLNIDGGKHGILVVSGTDICKATQVAEQQVDGQNGKTADADIYLQTPACALKIVSKKVGETSVAVKVGGLGAGKVTVTGKGIKKTTKTISKSTVATITAKRTKGKPGKVTVSFDPTGPAKAHKTTK